MQRLLPSHYLHQRRKTPSPLSFRTAKGIEESAHLMVECRLLEEFVSERHCKVLGFVKILRFSAQSRLKTSREQAQAYQNSSKEGYSCSPIYGMSTHNLVPMDFAANISVEWR